MSWAACGGSVPQIQRTTIVESHGSQTVTTEARMLVISERSKRQKKEDRCIMVCAVGVAAAVVVVVGFGKET